VVSSVSCVTRAATMVPLSVYLSCSAGCLIKHVLSQRNKRTTSLFYVVFLAGGSLIFLRPLDSSGTFNSFESFPSRELFVIHGIGFAVPTKLSQRLPSVFNFIHRLDSFTRFLEYSGSMIRDIPYTSSSSTTTVNICQSVAFDAFLNTLLM
jgi:hypothetical protein